MVQMEEGDEEQLPEQAFCAHTAGQGVSTHPTFELRL